MVYGRSITADIVLDIETLGDPIRASDVEEFMSKWEPAGNIKKEETIERHRAQARIDCVAKLQKDNAFSIDKKRMISLAVGIADRRKGEVTDIQSWASEDLSVITKGFVEYVNGYGENFKYIGWNCNAFDFPEIIKSCKLTGVFPEFSPAKWGIIDLCSHPFRGMGLKKVAKSFGLDVPETRGDDVSELYKEGNWEAIQRYNESDVRITGEIYLAASKFFTF